MGFKFTKGSKVEVLDMREVPLGSWRCAEIISGNGHTYLVRYGHNVVAMGDVEERVSRKEIRPCPPVENSRSWAVGDIVEVFDNGSWKPVEVRMVVGGLNYFVKILGYPGGFRAHASKLRLRQSWKNNEWVVIGKDLEKPSDGMKTKAYKEGHFGHQMPQTCIKEKKRSCDNHISFQNCNGEEEFHQDYKGGTKKRRPISLTPVETCTKAGIKMWRNEKGRMHHLPVAWHAPNPHEKVDAVASPQILLGEKYMHASSNNKMTRICEMNMGRKMPSADEFCFMPIQELSDNESTQSSVASCSADNSPYRPSHPICGPSKDLNNHCNDAETSSGSESEPLPPLKEAMAEEVHRLELHAYRTTLVALHASGPISWEQESLMTNLRLMLHISTDEHLSELRKLASNNVPIR